MGLVELDMVLLASFHNYIITYTPLLKKEGTFDIDSENTHHYIIYDLPRRINGAYVKFTRDNFLIVAIYYRLL